MALAVPSGSRCREAMKVRDTPAVTAPRAMVVAAPRRSRPAHGRRTTARKHTAEIVSVSQEVPAVVSGRKRVVATAVPIWRMISELRATTGAGRGARREKREIMVRSWGQTRGSTTTGGAIRTGSGTVLTIILFMTALVDGTGTGTPAAG